MAAENPVTFQRYSIVKTPPTDLYEHGSLIHHAYRGEQPPRVPIVSMNYSIEQTSSVRKAEWLISAQDAEGKPVGLLAYSFYTRESSPEFFHHIDTQKAASDVHEQIDRLTGVFITHEMTVSPEMRGRGVFRDMRQVSLQDIEGPVCFVGEVQHLTSANLHYRIDNSVTAWAGIPLNVNPDVIPSHLLLPTSHVLGNAFLDHLYPGQGETLQNGVFSSKEFDSPATMPNNNKEYSPELIQAMKKLVSIQENVSPGINVAGLITTFAMR